MGHIAAYLLLALLLIAGLALWWVSRRWQGFSFLEEQAGVAAFALHPPDLHDWRQRLGSAAARFARPKQESAALEDPPSIEEAGAAPGGEVHSQVISVDGVARVQVTVELPPESGVQVTITHTRGEGVRVDQRPASGIIAGGWWSRISRRLGEALGALKVAGLANLRSLEASLFILAVLVYLTTRLVGLQDYPIYFFTDEAIQTVSAADLIRAGFRDAEKIFLPTYFKNGSFYNLSLSVYWQVLPTLLFGKSLLITRLAAVLATLLAVLAVGLILSQFFGVRRFWLGVMLLSITPAWFLHSRTAFETALFSSLYAAFLYAYLVYRYRSRRALYAALACAALCFYAYSPGQVVIAATGVLLLLSDLRYHWESRGMWWRAALLALVLAAPYLRLLDYRSSAPIDHLRILDSYWLEPISLGEKLARFASTYLYGLNPAYWFIPNDHDLQRHLMKGYPHLPIFSLPFFAVGLALLVKHWRSAAHRVLLIALLAAPTGSALVGIGITRVLAFTIPASLTSALGLAVALDWLEAWRSGGQEKKSAVTPGEEAVNGAPLFSSPEEGRLASRRAWVSLGVFTLLAGVNLFMLWDTLIHGPTWFQDYGLYGMQYGARQVFGEFASQYLSAEPGEDLYISSLWANGTDVFPRFFLALDEQKRVRMGSVNTYLLERRELDASTTFVFTQEEYLEALNNPKLEVTQVLKTLPYPNGAPGFYVLKMAYSEGAQAIFEKEAVTRRLPVSGEAQVMGQAARVEYSAIESGQVADMFDGDRYTVVRGYEANPFVVDIRFSQAVQVSGLAADFGSMDFTLSVLVYPEGAQEPVTFARTYRNLADDPHVELLLDGETFVTKRVRIEVLSLNAGEKAKIHVRELQVLP